MSDPEHLRQCFAEVEDIPPPGLESLPPRAPSFTVLGNAWCKELERLEKEYRQTNRDRKAQAADLAASVARHASQLPDTFKALPLLDTLGTWSSTPQSHSACVLISTSMEAVQHALAGHDGPHPTSSSWQSNSAAAWQRRHEGLLGHDSQIQAPKLESLCCRQGRCLCRGAGVLMRRFWTKAQRHVKTLLQHPDTSKKHLGAGLLCFCWTEFSLEEAALGKLYTYVPFHSFRPWEPTFLCMRRCHREDDPADALTLALQLQDEMPLFVMPYDFVATCNLDSKWGLVILKLSEHPRPFPHSAGQCRVLRPLLREADNIFWHGSVAEAQRMRTRRGAPRPVAPHRARFAVPLNQEQSGHEIGDIPTILSQSTSTRKSVKFCVSVLGNLGPEFAVPADEPLIFHSLFTPVQVAPKRLQGKPGPQKRIKGPSWELQDLQRQVS